MNISFARFLKNLLKNCQRLRDKFLYENKDLSPYKRHVESIYLVKKYLDEQLTPYGIIGAEHHIRAILSYKIIKKKTIKKLGRMALKRGRYIFLKDIFCLWHHTTGCDLREIRFREFDMEQFRRDRYRCIRPILYKDHPF